MRQSKGLRQIVWAVDAFGGVSLPHQNTICVLRALENRASIRIKPVYVLSPGELNIATEFTPPWIRYYSPAAKSALRALMKKTGLHHLDEEKILLQSIATKRKSVERLSSYAKRHRADLIVASTHARKGVARFFLGSFAETLILYSKVPVLIVGPRLRAKKGFKRILFPTDLSPASQKAFDRFLPVAKQLKASITLFHSIPNPVEPVAQSAIYLLGGAWVPVHRYFLEDIEDRKKKVRALAMEARTKGIPTQSFVDETGSSISNSIIQYSHKYKMDVIAMAAQSGAITSALVGSITRQVSRHAECPVWILHG